jgi:endoglucanase
VEQLGEDGTVVKEIWRVDFTSHRGWFYWTKDGGGRSSTNTGHDDAVSLAISGTTDVANLSADIYQFELEQGATYRMNGWMKGERVSEKANCQLRLDFFSAEAPQHSWDKAFLAQELDAYLAFGKRHGSPMYLGEFGTIVDSFQQDRGGIRWVEDMLSLLEERRLHFTYHAYHEDGFGLYYGSSTLPSPEFSNKKLIDLFETKLVSSK